MPSSSTVAVVKEDVALRLAASTIDGLGVDDARKFLAEFIAQLRICPVCGDTGRFTVGREVALYLDDGSHRPPQDPTPIRAGIEGDCPRCGAPDEVSGKGRGDPAWVFWNCVDGASEVECRRQRASESEGQRSTHAGCDFRLAVPLDLGGG